MEDELKEGIPAIIEAARGRIEAKVIDVACDGEAGIEIDDALGSVPMLAIPKAGGGIELHTVIGEIKAYREMRRERPDRREGIAGLETLDSFVDHVNRFKDRHSAIWIATSGGTPRFTCVFDYHEAVNPRESDTKALPPATGSNMDAGANVKHEALPRFGKHRGSHVPEFSDEWKLWAGISGKGISQTDFTRVVEKGARDIVDVGDLPEGRLLDAATWFHSRFGGKATPAEFYADSRVMLTLAEGLVLNINEKVGEVQSRAGGSKAIVFESETKATNTVDTPTAFLLEIPIFRGGDLIQIPARLRVYARQQGDGKRTEWTVEMYGIDRAIRLELRDMAESIATRTGLPIFFGAPE